MIYYTKEHLRMFKSLGRNDIPYGLTMLSHIYLFGCPSLGIAPSTEAAKDFAKLAYFTEKKFLPPKEKQNKPEYARGYGYYIWGSVLINGSNKKEGLELLIKSASLNNSFGLHALGVCCTLGISATKDPARGYAFSLQSAQLGNPFAQYFIGLCYENGNCASPCKERAIYWYEKAAEQGHVDAKMKLQEDWVIQFKESQKSLKRMGETLQQLKNAIEESKKLNEQVNTYLAKAAHIPSTNGINLNNQKPLKRLNSLPHNSQEQVIKSRK